jgi:hypothetical protein
MGATIGFKAHTGWAAVVAIAGPKASPRIVAKHRIELAAGFDAAAVFHAGRELPFTEAERMIREAEDAFTERAEKAIRAFLASLPEKPSAAAIVSGAPKALPPLASILKSHALVHTAEGELFRRVLATACDALGVPATRVQDFSRAPSLDEAGKASGKPWAADQKEAARSAWLLLR